MSTIADLLVRLGLDTSDFDKGIKNTETKASGLKGKFGDVAFGIANTFQTVGAAGLGAFAGAATMATTAIAGTTIALGKMAIDSANVEGIKNAFYGIAEAAGSSGEKMIASLQKGSAGMVSQTELMQSFNSAAQLVSVDFAQKLPDAMQYLGKVSSATGQDMGFMLDSLVRGVGRLSPMILDNLGIQVDLEEAYTSYSKSIGKATGELSKEEQQTALMNQVMEKLATNTASMPEITENAATKFAQFKATLADTKMELGVAFMPAVLSVMDAFKRLVDSELIPGLIDLVVRFAESIVGLVEKFTPFLGVIEMMGSGLLDATDALMSGDMEGFADAIGNTIDITIGKITEMLPGFIQAGGQMMIMLVQGIATAIPGLMTAGVMIMNSLVSVVLDLLPSMLEVGLQIIVNLALGIAQALPTLIPTIVELLLSLTQVIIENLPLLIEAGLQLVTGLALGLVEALPVLIEMAPTLIVSFITAILEMLPVVISSAGDIVMALAEGIALAIPLLFDAAWQILVGIDAALTAAWPKLNEAGAKLLCQLIEGIVSMVSSLNEAVREVGKKIIEPISEKWGEMKEAGINLITGFLEGIRSKFADIWNEVREFVGKVVDTVKGALKSHSPSMVFFDIGKNMMLGMEQGIESFSTLPEVTLKEQVTGFATAHGGEVQGGYGLQQSYPAASEIGKAVVYALMQAGVV